MSTKCPQPSSSSLHQALIVHSSPEIDKLLANLFDPQEWSLRFVSDNKEALQVADAEYFDLIITG